MMAAIEVAPGVFGYVAAADEVGSASNVYAFDRRRQRTIIGHRLFRRKSPRRGCGTDLIAGRWGGNAGVAGDP